VKTPCPWLLRAASSISALAVLLSAGCGEAFSGGDGGGSPQGGGGAGGTGASGATGAEAGGGNGAGGGSSAGGSGSTGGALSYPPECTTSESCQLVDDCCNCVALLVGEPAPPCAVVDCANDAPCVVNGIRAADPLCEAGRCVAGFDCDHLHVSCLEPMPSCNVSSQIPSVFGGCWSGTCVEPTECSYVATSDVCTSRGLVAVTVLAPTDERIHCVAPFPECVTPDCRCLGSSVCGDAPCFDSGPGRLSCDKTER
jgi:hypothetical protein